MNVVTQSTTRPQPARETRPTWLGGMDDLPVEHGFVPLDVRGSLPPELRGVLYRNGPGRFAVAGERYRHWFDGDGAVSAVQIAGGRAQGAAKVVQTRGLVREEAAGRRLFGAYDTPLARPLRELFLRDMKNPANTSVLLWQERLFALCEAGKPYEVDRMDLSTIGETDSRRRRPRRVLRPPSLRPLAPDHVQLRCAARPPDDVRSLRPPRCGQGEAVCDVRRCGRTPLSRLRGQRALRSRAPRAHVPVARRDAHRPGAREQHAVAAPTRRRARGRAARRAGEDGEDRRAGGDGRALRQRLRRRR